MRLTFLRRDVWSVKSSARAHRRRSNLRALVCAVAALAWAACGGQPSAGWNPDAGSGSGQGSGASSGSDSGPGAASDAGRVSGSSSGGRPGMTSTSSSGSTLPASSSGSSSGSTSGSSTGSSSGGSSSGAAGRDAGAGSISALGCNLLWGSDPSGSLASSGWLQFVSAWAGFEVQASGAITSCSDCGWLSRTVSPTNLIPVYYAYFIGYYGHANGLQDGNVNPNGPNLTNGGAALILANYSKIIAMYTYYAQQTAKVWPTKPLIWLLEGDFVQYAASSQKPTPLTYAQLGQLAADITTAIKANMPNAIVAIDHSAWLSTGVSNTYWSAMSAANYDLIWTTGVGNNAGFANAGQTSGVSYASLHSSTGRKIFVDESFGLSVTADTWSNQSAATINARISEGIVAVNLTSGNPPPPPASQAAITALRPQLSSICP
jgi:hypothetical protein